MSFVGGLLAREEVREQRLNGLESLATAQKGRVEQVISNYGTMHKAISSQTQLRASLEEFNATGSAGAVESIGRILADARAPFSDNKGMLLLGPNGNVVVDQQDTKIPADRYPSLYERGSKAYVVQPIEIAGTTMIMHTAPIEHATNTIGVLVMLFSTEALRAITHSTDGLGNTGETLLGYRSSNDEAVLFPTRLQSSPEPIRINKDNNLPVIPTLLNKQDIRFKSATDYRGAKIMAATRYIKDAEWAVVIKQDQAEVFHDVSTFMAIYTFIAVVIITIAIGIGILLRDSL